MKKWCVYFLPTLLFAEWEQLFTDSDPTLFHQVNVTTGHLNFMEQDLNIAGAFPFPIFKTYCSAESIDLVYENDKNPLRFMPTQGGWNLFAHNYLVFSKTTTRYSKDPWIHEIEAWEPSGALLSFKFGSKNHDWFNYKLAADPEKISTHSAHHNPCLINLSFCFTAGVFHMRTPSGGLRIYTGDHVHKSTTKRKSVYCLQEEHLPSGHRVFYTYDDKKRLKTIEVKSPKGTQLSLARLTHDSDHKAYRFSIDCSDNQNIEYRAARTNRVCYIDTLKIRGLPEQRFGYTRLVSGDTTHGVTCSSIHVGNITSFFVDYKHGTRNKDNKKKVLALGDALVQSISVPSGQNGELCQLSNFKYHPGKTIATEPSDKKTIFLHEKNALNEIEYYNTAGKLDSKIKYFWKDRFIKTKVQFDQKGQPVLGVTYEVDGKGNILKETLFGNLSGAASPISVNSDGNLSGGESYSKNYIYHPYFNVPTEETDSLNHKIIYRYKPDTNLCTETLKFYNHKILERVFHFYDEDHLLIKTIKDDGITETENDLTGVHLREIVIHNRDRQDRMITETAHYFQDPITEELFLNQRTVFHYDDRKLIIKKDHYDRSNTYRYSTEFHYDDARRLDSYSDALGQWSYIKYDELGRVNFEHKARSSPKRLSHDALGRPTKTITTTSDHEEHIESVVYGPTRDPIIKTDRLGHITLQEYDLMHRAHKTIFPSLLDDEGLSFQPIVELEYDTQDNIISSTDGIISTYSEYTSYKKPSLHINAAGDKTISLYDLQGRIVKKTDIEGISVSYEYDEYDHLIHQKRVLDNQLIAEESWSYEGPFLKDYTSETGVKTVYFYNEYGEKIKEDTLGRITEYFYNNLGQLIKTSNQIQEDHKEYDLLGRVTRTYQVTAGLTLNDTEYVFDNLGQLKTKIRKTETHSAIDKYSYDGLGREISHTDPLGNSFSTEYVKVTNSLGQIVEDKITTDPFSQKTRSHFDVNGKLVSVEVYDHLGNSVSKQIFVYNRLGQKVKVTTESYNNGLFEKEHSIHFKYDLLGNLLETDEAGRKTSFQYDARYRISKKNLPSGVFFTYSYDAKDRLIEIYASDGSVHDTYEYDRFDEPIKATNHVSGIVVTRLLDAFGEIIEETRGGLITRYQYDNAGRIISLELPSAEPIYYEYTGRFLSSIQYKNYTHTYASFNLSGLPKKKTLFGDWGTYSQEYDLLNRPISLQDRFHHLLQSYNAKGLVNQVSCSIQGLTHYHYDALNQLILENQNSTPFDAFRNPRDGIISSHNELLEYKGKRYTYDEDGRLIQNGVTKYKYDALGRLRSIESGEKTTTIDYDSFSRPHNITKNHIKSYLLYADELEVGLLDASNNLIELKILGGPLASHLLDPVAYQFGDKLYYPMTDLKGSCLGLVDENGIVVETTRYDGFGYSTNPLSISPWGYLQIRSYEGLYLMGCRFYDPEIKRFITTDPLGYVEGINLYVYALNCPLNRHDLSGLFDQSLIDSIMWDTTLRPVTNDQLGGINEYYSPLFGDLPLIDQPNRLQGPPKLMASINDIKTSPQFFTSQIYTGESYSSCVVSLPKNTKFSFSNDEVKSGRADLLTRFPSILSSTGKGINLFIHINGINTSLNDMKKMVSITRNAVPENTIILGIHNPTYGTMGDLNRYLAEQNNRLTPTVMRFAQFLGHYSEMVSAVNPNLRVRLSLHSEAGIIYDRAFDTMPANHQALVRSNFIIRAYGPALPVSLRKCLNGDNFYSTDDYVTKRFATPYLNNKDYIIKFLTPKSSFKQRTGFFADHAFLGDTYQTAELQSIQDDRVNIGICND